MVDYHKYRELMNQSRESLRQAADVLKRKDLAMEEREGISESFKKQAASLRREAMTFAKASNTVVFSR